MYRKLIFPGFARLTRISNNASRRSSERGRLVRTAVVVCAALGIDTDLTLVYQLFALLLCLVVVSRLTLRLRLPAVSVQRKLPRYATAGEVFHYYVDVTNEGGNVERDLKLLDIPRVTPPTWDEFTKAREPGEETRNAYDRYIGFHRFVWLQKIRTGIVVKQQDVADINVRSRTRVKVEALPLRRGIVHFQSTFVLHPDPIGLNYGITPFENPQQFLVLPRRYQIPEAFEVPGGRHFQPGGANATWSIGESDEFASLREYRDGDSLRKIHWASSAKRNKMVVKEFQDEYFVRQALVLDTDALNPEILDEAVSVAASFALRMTDAESLLDLVYLSDQLEVITSGHGRDSINRQLEALACVAQTKMPLSLLVNVLLQRAGSLSGCILVLARWDEERSSMIEKLRATGIAMEVFLVAPTIDAAVPTYVRQLAVRHVAEGLAALKAAS